MQKFVVWSILGLLLFLSPSTALTAESMIDLAGRVKEQTQRSGVGCLANVLQDCLSFIEKTKKNKLLADALNYAKSRNVFVVLSDHFGVQSGIVTIDVNTTDEKVIKFLLGK